jgi:hypothetical protein
MMMKYFYKGKGKWAIDKFKYHPVCHKVDKLYCCQHLTSVRYLNTTQMWNKSQMVSATPLGAMTIYVHPYQNLGI